MRLSGCFQKGKLESRSVWPPGYRETITWQLVLFVASAVVCSVMINGVLVVFLYVCIGYFVCS